MKTLPIFFVDDCTPETLGVFTDFGRAVGFAVRVDADRIREGELDSEEWARPILEKDWAGHWIAVGRDD